MENEFIDIFEISHLFNVSGITARRYINEILNEMELLEEKVKLDTQKDDSLSIQKLNDLSKKARRRIIGQTKAGKDMFILELSKSEALSKWGLRPSAKTSAECAQNMTNQNVKSATQMINQEDDQGNYKENAGEVVDSFGQKYIKLLESQLNEKDDTIKDLRETNKFLSITNGKLNEQMKLMLEKPKEPGKSADPVQNKI